MEEKISHFLILRNINKNYGGVKALEKVDLDIMEGEIHCLVGENGSGKSTLVKIITGVVKPEPGGKIEIKGESFEFLDPLTSFLKGIHVVHQDLSLFPNLSVAENIAIHEHVMKKSGLVNWKRIYEVADRVMKRLGIYIDPYIQVEKLSVADQQLVAICRSLASDAKLMILDEPTSSLTSREVERLFSILRDLKSRGISILFISHRLDEVLDIGERITVLKDGKKVGTFRKEELDKKKLTYLMTGRELAFVRRSKGLEKKVPILKVENLTKYGQFENVSFELHSGEILGLIGPRGAGRTELALSLFGMNPPDSGRIFVEGKEVSFKSNRDAIKHGIGYVPENRLTQGLVLEQSVKNNLVITILERILNDFRLIDEERKNKVAEEMVRKFGIKTAGMDVAAKTLSGGNQQKVVLAKWISTAPKILILDGPTMGIDVAAKESIYRLVSKLANEGIAVLFISDESSEVTANCDRIMLMKNRKIVGVFKKDEISEEELERRIKE